MNKENIDIENEFNYDESEAETIDENKLANIQSLNG